MKHFFRVLPGQDKVEAIVGKSGEPYFHYQGQHIMKDNNDEVVSMNPHNCNSPIRLDSAVYEIDFEQSIRKVGYDLKVGFMMYMKRRVQQVSPAKSA